MMLLTSDLIHKLGEAFPDGVLRCVTLEFFPLGKDGRCSVSLGRCNNEEDIKCAMLGWLSRDAYKSMPYSVQSRNDRFNREVREGMNRYLGTDFLADDMRIIYSRFGYGTNKDLTRMFVRSGYNMDLLKEVVK